MKPRTKVFALFLLLSMLAFTWVGPAMAFDGIEGQNVTIEADEVIEDDLYVAAENFTLEGTIKGDLIVMGQNITINGTVEGDLLAMGQGVVINGTVIGDARIAGSALQLGKTASVTEDLLAGGASLESREGSEIGGELLFGAGQSLLAGNVSGDVMGGAGSLELRGTFGGDVNVEVGDAGQGGPSPSTYMPNTTISIPSVAPGFTISKDAKIEGNLTYSQSKDINIPAGTVLGKITRNEPVADEQHTYTPPTTGEIAVNWTLDLLRTIVTLIALGLLLGWLAPNFVKALIEKAQTNPAANIGWGLVSYAAFFFVLLVILAVMIAGGMFFGVLTLGGISGTIIWLGILAMLAITVGFILAVSFLTKIVVAWLGGKLILNRFNPALAEHKVWPLVLGVVIVAFAMALPLIGWLIGFMVVLLGLGALWTWGRERWQSRQTA
jgi:cytoskeletal protein CcmA (bactofilin family)